MAHFPSRSVRFTLFLAAATLAGCSISEADVASPAPPPPVPVVVATATPGTIHAVYASTATLEADAEAAVAARAGGQIVEILVEEGDEVRAGEVLARIDGERAHLALRQAAANLAKVENRYRRYRQLHESGMGSAESADRLRHELDALTAAHRLARLDYEETYVRAPINGVITVRQVKAGTTVGVGDELFRIADPVRLLVSLHLPQSELGKVRSGQAARLSLDALPGQEFAARVVRIAPVVDNTSGTVKVTVEPTDTGTLARPGMYARVSLLYDEHTDALLVPRQALLEEDQQTTVYVVDSGIARRRIVVTGLEAPGRVEILDGLEAGARIVVTGHRALRDGATVREESI